MTDWKDCGDDLVAAWAADSQARTRAYAVYGSATEAPTAEDEAVTTEWKRRDKEGRSVMRAVLGWVCEKCGNRAASGKQCWNCGGWK